MKRQDVFFPALMLCCTLVSSWALARLSTAMAKKTLSRVSVVAEVKERKLLPGESERTKEERRWKANHHFINKTLVCVSLFSVYLHTCILHICICLCVSVRAGYSCQRVWGRWRKWRRPSLCRSLLPGTRCRRTSPCSSPLRSGSTPEDRKWKRREVKGWIGLVWCILDNAQNLVVAI